MRLIDFTIVKWYLNIVLILYVGEIKLILNFIMFYRKIKTTQNLFFFPVVVFFFEY